MLVNLYLKFSPKIFLTISILFVFLLLGEKAFYIVFILLMLWSLINVKNAIQSLTLISIISILNPGLFSIPNNIALLRWIVLILALSRIYFEIIRTAGKIIYPKEIILKIVLFFLIVSIFSIVTSYYPFVSLFKLFVFTTGTIGILVAFKLTEKEYYYWFRWFVNVFALIVVVSAMIYFFPQIGFYKREQGAVYSSFQGVFNHPQAMGTFITPILSFITIIVLTKGKIQKFSIILILLGWFVLVMTKARVGMISSLISFLIYYFYVYFFEKKWFRKLKKRIFNPIFLFILSIGLFFVVLFSNNVFSVIEEYALKNSNNYLTVGNVGMVDAMVFSRGMLIRESWLNFQNNKIVGIGFGIATRQDKMNVNFDPVLGLPIGASVEKGFIFSAILEETGLIGFFLFMLIIIALVKNIFSRTDIFVIVLFLSSFFINFGEMLFFSLGGLGLYIWLLIGLSTLKPPSKDFLRKKSHYKNIQ